MEEPAGEQQVDQAPVTARRWWLAAELTFLAAFLLLFHSVVNPALYTTGRTLFPGPDGIEYAWFAFALNEGRSPMVAVAHEVHPSRYGPIHPLCMAAYMFLDGDGMDSFLQYSEVAMMLACVCFWAMLAGLGARAPTRIAAVLVVFYSSQPIRRGRSLMPETTICMMLLAGAALGVWCARFAPQGAWGRRLAVAGFVMAGALCAVPGTIRPSLLPLAGLPILAALFGMEGDGRRRALLAVSLGACCTPLLTMVANRGLMGYWGLTAYDHWTSSIRFMNPSTLLSPTGAFPHAPSILQLTGEAFLGRSMHLARSPGPALPIVWGLALFSVLRFRAMPPPSRAYSWFPAFALVTFGVNFLFHLVYFFHDMRFHLMNFALVGAAAMMGAERLFLYLSESTTEWVRSFSRITATLGVFMIPDAALIPEDTIYLQVIARPPKSIVLEATTIRNAKIAGKVIRDFHVPVFTRGIPVGGARVLMHLEQHLHVPFCSLMRVREYSGDSHVVQFHWDDVGPPSRLIVTGAPWDSIRPHEAWLIDPLDGSLNEDFARAVIERHGAFIVYYQIGAHNGVVPLLEWSKAQGWPVTNLKPYRSFGLYLVGVPK